jgi:hypothetical protein
VGAGDADGNAEAPAVELLSDTNTIGRRWTHIHTIDTAIGKDGRRSAAEGVQRIRLQTCADSARIAQITEARPIAPVKTDSI